MKTPVTRLFALLLGLIIAVFGCMCIAHGIQTDHGNVAVSRGTLDTDAGELSYKLYVP